MKLNYEFNGEHHSRTRYIIYKIENTISRKYYVGQTRRELKERLNENPSKTQKARAFNRMH